MERLGIYIFVFFFLGLAFFERVRTLGETGSLWRVLSRNLLVLLVAALVFFIWGIDLVFPGIEWKLFKTARSIINYQAPYGTVEPGHHLKLALEAGRHCLFCGAAALIAAVGIWELKLGLWKKWILTGAFSFLIYPVFGWWQWGNGFLAKLGFHDLNGALIIWALPAAFVLGARLASPRSILPAERTHDFKGIKILPGMKERFFLSRGIGLIMIFLVLNATTLTGHKWVWSKTLTVIPASLTLLFSQMLFYSLLGRNKPERVSYAPPIFALMAALVATQSCKEYNAEQAVFASIATTLAAVIYMRFAPQRVRIWDPICSLPIFLLGGSMGVAMASLTDAAQLKTQLLGIAAGIGFGVGAGLLLMSVFRVTGTGRTADEKTFEVRESSVR